MVFRFEREDIDNYEKKASTALSALHSKDKHEGGVCDVFEYICVNKLVDELYDRKNKEKLGMEVLDGTRWLLEYMGEDGYLENIAKEEKEEDGVRYYMDLLDEFKLTEKGIRASRNYKINSVIDVS